MFSWPHSLAESGARQRGHCGDVGGGLGGAGGQGRRSRQVVGASVQRPPTLRRKRERMGTGCGGATKRSGGAGPPAPTAHGSASQETAYFFTGFLLLGCFST